MNTIDDIRRQKLAMLAKEFGGVGGLAIKIGKSSAQVSQWINASPDSRTGKPRGMRTESCRKIEALCGKPTGWMDQDDADQDRSEAGNADHKTGQVFHSKVNLSPTAARLIREIIEAEEQGSSTPEIIDVLIKVLHVALPHATELDYPKLRDELGKRRS